MRIVFRSNLLARIQALDEEKGVKYLVSVLVTALLLLVLFLAAVLAVLRILFKPA